jgi:hypothetical protein
MNGMCGNSKIPLSLFPTTVSIPPPNIPITARMLFVQNYYLDTKKGIAGNERRGTVSGIMRQKGRKRGKIKGKEENKPCGREVEGV